MTNDEQLKVLMQGATAWNKWRKEHPDDPIYLRDADLREANVSGANLIGADIRGIYLWHVE